MRKAILLQFSTSQEIDDTEILLSNTCFEELGRPVVVTIAPLTRQKKGDSSNLLESIILKVRANEELQHEQAAFSESVLHAILSKEVSGSSSQVIRLSLLENAVGITNGIASGGVADDPAKQKMLAEVCDLVEKLTHEKEWYYKQAEEFRSQLEQASEALELAMEERRVAVSMYAQARELEQEMVRFNMTSNGYNAKPALENGGSSTENPYPVDSAVAAWLNDVGEGYASKFYGVLEECGYEQDADLEGMSSDEIDVLICALKDQGGAKAPQIRRLRGALGTKAQGIEK